MNLEETRDSLGRNSLTLNKSQVLLLGPPASSLTNEVGLSNFLVSTAVLFTRIFVVHSVGSTSPLLISAAAIPLFDLTSVGISIVENLRIQEFFFRFQAGQDRFYIVLGLFTDFL